jgi:hypothetical protein
MRTDASGSRGFIRKSTKQISALAVPSVDRSDTHAEMRAQEARAIVRAMPKEQRDRIERLPPALAVAVIQAPPELSGVSPSVHAMVPSELAKSLHPEKIKAL